MRPANPLPAMGFGVSTEHGIDGPGFHPRIPPANPTNHFFLCLSLDVSSPPPLARAFSLSLSLPLSLSFLPAHSLRCALGFRV